ncbi:uncharacterized protein PFLUO_LOCUS5599 [Penicillium psychrofluorescens]|uniref:uncharacterized protein n=1 Tax=Penicillium psychrofluorescens TaxID=3158075 RepID=UPI003CCDF83D
MTSWRRVTAATSSATLRLIAFIFLRWIPGHHFVPIVFTSLAVYLSTLFSLLRDDGVQDRRKEKPRKRTSKLPPSSVPAKTSESALKTLLTGLPSARSPALTWTTALINVLLALLTLDFLIRGFVLYPSNDVAFARIGYISPTTANLLLREPDPAQWPVVISYQEETAQKWVEEGKVYKLDDSTDFTAAVTLKKLKPVTHYRYSLSNNKTGSFVTSPEPGSSAATRMSFVTSSCLKPNFPYNILSHPLRVPGVEQMSAAISKLPALLRPAFMLFLGDFIYIDVPFRFGSSMSHYRSEYRRIYSSPSWTITQAANQPRALDLPWIHTLDDHEIENDWSAGNKTAPYPAAADPFIHYHVRANPPIPRNAFAPPDEVTYFSFVNGPASFFMLDTRTYRSEPAQENSTILGSAQLQSLLAYLSAPEPAGVRWKFVASSVPFTKNWHVGTTDTWGGFLDERRAVFEAMWRAERELGIRVVLLSGDRHEFGATRFLDPSLDNLAPSDFAEGAGVGIHEFSVGPLSMFYLPIRSYYQTDDQDVAIKYAPNGNSKFGLIDIEDGLDELGSESGSVRASVLTYSLYVDGDVVWKYQLSVPLDHRGADATVANSALPFPPGKVLEDHVLPAGWVLLAKNAIGRAEELGKCTALKATALYNDLLEKMRKTERLD